MKLLICEQGAEEVDLEVDLENATSGAGLRFPAEKCKHWGLFFKDFVQLLQMQADFWGKMGMWSGTESSDNATTTFTINGFFLFFRNIYLCGISPPLPTFFSVGVSGWVLEGKGSLQFNWGSFGGTIRRSPPRSIGGSPGATTPGLNFVIGPKNNLSFVRQCIVMAYAKLKLLARVCAAPCH